MTENLHHCVAVPGSEYSPPPAEHFSLSLSLSLKVKQLRTQLPSQWFSPNGGMSREAVLIQWREQGRLSASRPRGHPAGVEWSPDQRLIGTGWGGSGAVHCDDDYDDNDDVHKDGSNSERPLRTDFQCVVRAFGLRLFCLYL